MLVPNRKLKCCMLMFHVCLPPLCTAYAVIPSVGFIIEKINSNEIVGCSTSTFDQDQVLSLPFLECFFYSIPFNLTFTALILVLLFMCYLAIDFPSDFFFLPSASPSPVFPTYSCQLTGSNIQLNCSLLAKTLSVSLYNWWHLVMESRQCALRNPIQHFGHMCILIILLKRELITFIRFSKKKLRIIGI